MINLTNSEVASLKAIDERELDKLIEEALVREQSSALHQLALANCGPYVSTALHRFSEALAAYRAAKSTKNREQKSSQARRVRIPEHPAGHSDNIRPPKPGYPATLV